MRERRVVFTGDYLVDNAFIHAEAPDRYIRQHGIRSVMSAPLIGEQGAIGSLTVHSQARDAFDRPTPSCSRCSPARPRSR